MEKEIVEKVIGAYKDREIKLYTDIQFTNGINQTFTGYIKGFVDDTNVLMLYTKKDGEGKGVYLLPAEHLVFIEIKESLKG
jgi:hypothetical protein